MEALVQVADGLAAPVRSACEQLAKLGGDVEVAVIGVAAQSDEPRPVARAPRRKQGRQNHVLILPSGDAPN